MYTFLGGKPPNDDEISSYGGLGYGAWLHSLVEVPGAELHPGVSHLTAGSGTSKTSHHVNMQSQAGPVRRGRGRPRVNSPRDESAVEKRRAQVREAQRAYQKRKDTATASERRRCDHVLQVLSDLSVDIEGLLQAAADVGILKHDGEIPERLRRLWTTYDAAMKAECLGPELRLLQLKNERRQAAQQDPEHSGININRDMQQHPVSSRSGDPSIHEATIDLDLGAVNDSTLVTTFSTSHLHYPGHGRSIYEVVRDRQPEYHHTQSSA